MSCDSGLFDGSCHPCGSLHKYFPLSSHNERFSTLCSVGQRREVDGVKPALASLGLPGVDPETRIPAVVFSCSLEINRPICSENVGPVDSKTLPGFDPQRRIQDWRKAISVPGNIKVQQRSSCALLFAGVVEVGPGPESTPGHSLSLVRCPFLSRPLPAEPPRPRHLLAGSVICLTLPCL